MEEQGHTAHVWMLPISNQQQLTEEAQDRPRTVQARQRHLLNVSLPLQWDVVCDGAQWKHQLPIKAFLRSCVLYGHQDPWLLAAIHHWQSQDWAYEHEWSLLHLISDHWIGSSRFGMTSSGWPMAARASHSLRKLSAIFGCVKVLMPGSVPTTQLNQHTSGA